VALAQQLELLEVVARKQVGARERGFVMPRPFDEAVRELAVGARHRVHVQAHEGVAGAHRLRRRFAGHEARHGGAQVVDLLLVDLLHLRERGGRVGVAGGGDEGGRFKHGGIVHARGAVPCVHGAVPRVEMKGKW
jgi:hypothetical protein